MMKEFAKAFAVLLPSSLGGVAASGDDVWAFVLCLSLQCLAGAFMCKYFKVA